MLAAQWHARKDIRVEDIPDPGEPPAGWVRLRIEACGICGTDVEEYAQGPVVLTTEPHPLTGSSVPVTLGHESVGVVEVVGRGARLDVGTRVAVEANLSCGECWSCKRGWLQLCDKLASLGFHGDGGLAEYMLAPAATCAPFGDHLSSSSAALSEPLAVAVRAVRKGRVSAGGSVAILGAGTIGLLTLQTAKLSGAGTVVVADRLAERRALALELGADYAVCPEELFDVSREATKGIGTDVTFEAAGNPAAVAEAVRVTRKAGRAVLLGVFDADFSLPMKEFLFGEKEVVSSLSHVFDEDFTTAVSLIDSGAVKVDPLITDIIALADVVDLGFEALVREPQAHLKIVVKPHGDQG